MKDLVKWLSVWFSPWLILLTLATFCGLYHVIEVSMFHSMLIALLTFNVFNIIRYTLGIIRP